MVTDSRADASSAGVRRRRRCTRCGFRFTTVEVPLYYRETILSLRQKASTLEALQDALRGLDLAALDKALKLAARK